jgi:2-keto-myo-inositol isomerase
MVKEKRTMKIGFNEATALKCKGQSLMADLEMCEKYGYDYIEIRFDCIKDYLKEHSLNDLAAWFKSHKLKPWAYNTLIFFNLRDAAGVKEIDDEIDFIIQVCNAIGMKMLITVPSFDVGPLSIEEIKKEAVQRLTYIADKVALHGIRVSLEFCGCPNCSINQFGTAYDVVKAVNKENVGITLDTFHFHAMDSHWEDLEKVEGKKIFAFHLNDSENLPIGAMLDDKRLWPGEGCLDHDRTLKILKKIGFDGVCTIEEFRPEYYELSLDDNIRIAKEKTVALVSKYYNFG